MHIKRIPIFWNMFLVNTAEPAPHHEFNCAYSYLKNTTNTNFDSELQPNVGQMFDLQQPETQKYVHPTVSHFQKHVSSKHRGTGRHVFKIQQQKAIRNATKHHFDFGLQPKVEHKFCIMIVIDFSHWWLYPRTWEWHLPSRYLPTTQQSLQTEVHMHKIQVKRSQPPHPFLGHLTSVATQQASVHTNDVDPSLARWGHATAREETNSFKTWHRSPVTPELILTWSKTARRTCLPQRLCF